MVNKLSYPSRKELAYEDTILRKAIAKTKNQQRQSGTKPLHHSVFTTLKLLKSRKLYLLKVIANKKLAEERKVRFSICA